MRTRHPAALALLGWYLLLPPPTGRLAFDKGAPLARWDKVAIFDDPSQCEHYQDDTVHLFTKNEARLERETAQYNTDRYLAGKCMYSEDVRINEKAAPAH